MDLMNCCRICIQSSNDMRSINDFDICGKMKIVDKINICANLTTKNHHNIPDKICLKCLEDLHIAYRFKMNCETAETILKSIYDGHVITDLIMSSDNGEIFKYEPPKGLRVKRITKEEIENQSQEITTIKSEMNLTGGDDNRGNNDTEDDDNDEDETIFLNAHDYEDTNFIQEDEHEDDVDNDEHLSINEFINGPHQEMKIEYLDNDLSQDFPQETVMEYNNETLKEEKLQPKQEDNISLSSKSNKERKVKRKVDSGKSNEKGNEFRGRKPVADDLKPIKICDICGNTYKYKHALESHMRRHRNEKPFSCEICGRSFVINFELRRHMRTHTGQKPYACNFCSRRFSDFGSRIKHERTHTGERPYTCETCGKSFAYAHVLSSHLLIHTGEKRYGCEECGKRFTKSHHLKTHKNTHYKTKKTDWIEPSTTTFLIDPAEVDNQEIVMAQNDDVISVLTTENNRPKQTTTMYLDAEGKVLTSDIKIIYN